MPRQDFGPDIVYGSLRLGKLVELLITDERRYRDPQPCNDHLLAPCPDDEAPGHTMLGDRQKRWFKSALTSSRATWKLWGSEVMVMSLDTAAPTPTTPGAHANPDQWDGYSFERKEILTDALSKHVKNLVVLSGDIHTFIAGNLTTTGGVTGQAVGTELVGGSITSLGLADFLGGAAGNPGGASPDRRQAHDLRRLRQARLLRGHGEADRADRRVQGGRYDPAADRHRFHDRQVPGPQRDAVDPADLSPRLGAARRSVRSTPSRLGARARS